MKNSPLYESVKYNIDYNKEIPELLDLICWGKHFMYYMHIPKESDGIWFCEGRFFTYDEIELGYDNKLFHIIDKFVKSKKINYMDFLEEWVGLVFHLTAEYLLFKKKVKVIFYSCDKCYRPSLFIKEEIKNEEDDTNKIWGTINIVDTIIYNYTQGNISSLCKGIKRSKNNIIYHDESFSYRPEEVSKDCDKFKKQTDGAFILTTTEDTWDNLIKEIRAKEKNYKFDLIISGSTTKKILKKINKLQGDNFINRVCIYTINIDKYLPLLIEFPKIQGVYKKTKQVIDFIHSEEQNSEYYPIIQLVTYDDYISKYMIVHKSISNFYGEAENKNCFKRAISYLKDFLLWYPKLKIKRGNKDKLKIEVLLETLQKFKGINDNEDEIINIYTQESGSFYQDFNYWLYDTDPLAIEKTSWFIATVISSLNKYAEKNGKGLKESKKLYRGIKSNLSDVLSYERAKGEIICFPSFTSTSLHLNVAKGFAKPKENSNQYETIITINYIYKNGFIPTAVDVSSISKFPQEGEHLFFPYSFFVVKNVQIKHSKRKAEIELDTVGRKENLEKYIKEGYKIIYNKDGFMDVVEPKPQKEPKNEIGNLIK